VIVYFYTGMLGRGGMESVLATVANGLTARGHEVRVLAAGVLPDTPASYLAALPNFTNCSREQFGLGSRFRGEVAELRHTLSLQNVLRTLPEPDAIVAVHAPMAVGVAKLATNMMRKRPPVVSWLHNPPERLPQAVYLQYADAHLAISSGIGKRLQALVPHRPVSVVFNPVPEYGGQTVPRPAKPAFVYMGRLDNEQKRVDVLLRGLGQLTDLDWRLDVIGGEVVGSGKDEPMLRQLAEELDVADRIAWHGWLERPWDRVREATALLLASDYEGFPMVAGEALARGVPVVASNCPTGPDDLVIPGTNGYLFQPGDASGMAAILRGIATGELPLPSAEACAGSVRRFAAGEVIDRIGQTLRHYSIHLAT